MSFADIIVIVVVLLSGIVAFRLGLMRVVFGLAAWVGATFATIYGFSFARPLARQWIGNELIADIAAGAAIFIVSMVILTFISHMLSGGVRESGFGMLDRTLGLVAGLIIGGAIVSGAYIFSQQFFGLNDNSPFYRNAKSLPVVRRGATVLASLVPGDWNLKPKAQTGASEGTFQNLLSPKPKDGEGEQKPGYNKLERQEMDRLIRNHQ